MYLFKWQTSFIFRYLSLLLPCSLLFQGNILTCTCVSHDKRWLATADAGQNSMVIIWDTQAGWVETKSLKKLVVMKTSLLDTHWSAWSFLEFRSSLMNWFNAEKWKFLIQYSCYLCSSINQEIRNLQDTPIKKFFFF